ncbi:MAG TPA: hypothetical protein VJU18_11180 [Vicinamibacteria bacterium]|nr:hypothetical protein [Vicinamibacteria bacterium]
MISGRASFYALNLLWILAASGVAQDPTPPSEAKAVKMDRLTWGKEVDGEAPIRHLEVRNDYGDIRARFTEERKLGAWAVVQRLDPGPEGGVGFTVERRGDTIALTVAYPPGRTRDRDPSPPQDSYDRLDLTVFIPEGLSLGATTLRGMVEARGLRSDLSARTLAGNVFAASSGTIQALTSGGAISAFLTGDPGTSPRPYFFQSATGPITLTLPPTANLALDLRTGGQVTSVFPVKRAPGRAHGQLGRGGRLLLAVSDTGPLELRRAER